MQYYIEEKQFFQNDSIIRIEAGFEKHKFKPGVRAPYFLIVILYVLFDIELVVLFPLLMKGINSTSSFININILLFIVIITLIVE